jgi:hypothetical protein
MEGFWVGYRSHFGGEMVSRHRKSVHFYPGIFGATKNTSSYIRGDQDSVARVGGSFSETEI